MSDSDITSIELSNKMTNLSHRIVEINNELEKYLFI